MKPVGHCATTPGRRRVNFIIRDQLATLELDVQPYVIPPVNSDIIVEPSIGKLAVGEKIPLRAFVVTPDGNRIPMSAAFSSTTPNIAAVSGSMVQGMAPGEVTIMATVPGIESLGKAILNVEQVDFDRLAFSPASLRVAIGQRKPFEVFGITRTGRMRLGEDPNLKLFGVSSDEDSGTDLSGSANCEVFGLGVGAGAVLAKWKGKLQQRMPVAVELDRILELVIQPENLTVAVGDSVDYQIMARRNGRLQPLEVVDGVQVTIDDTQIASENDLRVTAKKAGKTQVVARYGNLNVQTQLTVTTRSDPVPPTTTPKGLRFLSDFLLIEVGDVAGQVNVVRIMSDGREDVVDGLVNLKIRGPHDVVEILSTPNGPVIQPKNVGSVVIEASLGGLSSERQFRVDVLPQTLRQPEVRARPELLRILVVETKRFSRAEILPVTSGRPLPVPFTVTAAPNKFIEINADGSIRGLAPGTAVVTVTTNDPDGKYAGIENAAIVEVVDPNTR